MKQKVACQVVRTLSLIRFIRQTGYFGWGTINAYSFEDARSFSLVWDFFSPTHGIGLKAFKW